MKSENYFQNVQQKLVEAFESQDPELFDVVFDIGGQKLYAHKFYLSIISDTFKAMLSDRWNSKNEPIEIKGYKFEDFKEFIKFIYSGECSINDENIFTILDMAEFYHINHLKELCDEYLSKLKLTEENIFKLMETSNKYLMIQLKQSLQTNISQNFPYIVKSDAFLNADKSIIEELISLELNVVRPEDIFQAVYEWSEHQAKQKQQESINFNLNAAIKAEMKPFLPKIQFKKMNLKFLHTFVVKRGFLFTYDELSDILDNANPDLKVTVTNSNGESIYGYLDPTSNAKTIDVLKSLNNCESNNGFNSFTYWETKCEIPTTPSTLKKKDDVKWYFIYFSDGDIGVRKNSNDGYNYYLLAEMFCDGEFSVTPKCQIEVE